MFVNKLAIVFLAMTMTVAAMPFHGGDSDSITSIDEVTLSEDATPSEDITMSEDANPTEFPDQPETTAFDDPIPDPAIGSRPLLVVLMEYSDLPHPAAVTPTFIKNQIYGPRPSLNDYYLETSYGQFYFVDRGHWSWITAWDDPLTAEDESTWTYWQVTPDPHNGGTNIAHGLRSLEAVGYDFATLDANNDGIVDMGGEVAYLMVDYRGMNYRLGSKRGMPTLTFDGKTVSGQGCVVHGDSPWITLYAHELAHQTLFLYDYYYIVPEAITQFTLMGHSAYANASGGAQTPIGPHHLDPFSKMKKGWYTPSVVTKDGFYNLDDAETNPVAYLLHDPAHGKDEYFLVENRWKGTSYDNTDALIGPLTPPLPPADAAADIPDQGLVIWHVDETRNWDGSTTGGYAKVDLIRRGGSDSNAAFNGADADYYDFWDGSAPENAKWNGGVNSKTGVWCVSTAGATMRTYLDVPGPGVLICSDPLETSAVPGYAGLIDVPLRNTGDVSDTFQITAITPSDVSATVPPPVTISAKTETTVTIQLTPVRACTTTPGPRLVIITATSTLNPGVTGSTIATLNVLEYGEPKASIATIVGDVDPGYSATYTVSILNDGNALDKFSLTFTAIDFGSAYLAYPTAIDLSWVSFSPANPSAPACVSTSALLTIAVPWDWAGMEDATYDFDVTAISSITVSASDTTSGQLTVHATPLSMMFYVKVEIMNLIADVEALPSSGAKDGLHAKATSALAMVEQAVDRYLLGDDPPASNHLETTQNKLGAFLNQIEAQRGKGLTEAQANDLASKAQLIIQHIDEILLII